MYICVHRDAMTTTHQQLDQGEQKVVLIALHYHLFHQDGAGQLTLVHSCNHTDFGVEISTFNEATMFSYRLNSTI